LAPGKTLGGSSSINGLIYVRGQAQDYDHWAALGNPGWSYEDVLPYFIKSEGNASGEFRLPWRHRPAQGLRYRRKARADRSLHRQAQQIGVPRTDDFNGRLQEGAGYYQLTTHKGLRCSTAKGYLGPARNRPNLHIETDAMATSLIMRGKRAIGVNFVSAGRHARPWPMPRSF
jgi:choline dehydrogenase